MLDRFHTWRGEMAEIRREEREGFAAYLRSQLTETQARRARPQTRDDHAILAAREAHYTRLLRQVQ